MMLISIFYFAIVFCLSGFMFTVVSKTKNLSKCFNTYKSVSPIFFHFLIIYTFQILNEKKMNEAVITQVYFSSIHFFILLMNTLVYCSAGELVLKQVSYTIK